MILESLQVAIILLLAPFLAGVLKRIRARLQMRVGAGVLQPYHDLAKLFGKGTVISEDSSWISRAAPYVCVAAMVLATALVPLFMTSTLGYVGDLLVLVYLLGMARIFMSLAGMDAGSTFGGMGSSREMSVSALVEPTLILSIFTMALITGTTGLGGISSSLADSMMVTPSLILAFSAFFISLLAENARIPVDNPSTHLELTMIHEAMLLEYSGRELAMMEYASMLRLTVFSVLLVNLFLPWGIALGTGPEVIALGAAAIAAKVLVLLLAIAILESSIAKLRLFRLPELLTASFTLSLLAVIAFYVL